MSLWNKRTFYNFIFSIDYLNEDNQRMIHFNGFQSQQWSPLFDANQMQVPPVQMSLVADKGFNYSDTINCFVNQKKNHLQITILLKTGNEQMPRFVYYNDVGLKVRLKLIQKSLIICSFLGNPPIQIRHLWN